MISPRFVALSVLLTLSSSISSVEAKNDWSQPCFNGVCEYDIPTTTGSSGTVVIWGPVDSIADITPAGGWEILGCDPNALEQEIRLVCTQSDNDSRAACGKLFATDSTPSTDIDGAVGKVVRLPESCGKGPFALITKAWTPSDQSIPSRRSFLPRADNGTSIAASGSSASSTPSTSVASIASAPSAASSGASGTPSGSAPVRALRLETNFGAAVPSTKAKRANTDPVLFAVKAANVQGAEGIDDSSLQTRSVQLRYSRRMVEERGLVDFVKGAVNAIKNLNTFSVDKNQDLPPINVDKAFNLVDQKVSCPPLTANLKVDVDAKANALVSIGLAASGTIVPPKVNDFSVITNLNAEIDGTLSLLAGVTGTADSGDLNLFQIGIPGLDVPGILTLGPSFAINAKVSAELDLSVNANVGLNYKIENAQLVFPPSGDQGKQGAFNIGDTPLKLSAAGTASATGTVEAHLIPTLNLGISALGGIVDATVFLNLDASAKMQLQADASASGSITVPVGGTKTKREIELLDEFEGVDVEQHTADDDDDDSADDEEEIEDVDVRSVRKPATRPSRPHRPIKRPSKPRKPVKRPTVPNKPVLITKPNESACPAAVTQTVTVTVDQPAGTPVSGGGVKTTSAAPVKTSSAAIGLPTKGLGNIDLEQPASSTVLSATTKGVSAIASLAAPAATTTSAGGIVKEGNTSFGGCFTIDAGLSVNAGANADFFGLFGKNTQVELFSKEFELLKKCFGDKAKRELHASVNAGLFGRSRFVARHSAISARSISRIRAVTRSLNTLERRVFDLSCPAPDDSADPASLTPLTDEVIPAADIRAV
ncbi:hypothetical protein BJ165DRAFT_1529291 [Panaeolus papilionaceus]|nr:hypothetical protein BJ165DRAFT_1529291 [Panaeolus papilionaceus]